jgi:hypothetical protein
MKFWIVAFPVVTLAAGCLISPGAPHKASADGGVVCTIPETGDASFCQASTNLTAKQVANQTSLCTSQQGTVVAAAACPEGAVGCCATTSGSVDFNQCFYGTSAATGEQQCATMAGIWTAGSETGDAGATD